MKLLVPQAIATANLVSATIAETDYAEWSAASVYATGNRVIRASLHRIYESLVAVTTIGSAPESSPLEWIDIGPTNRWALLDQSLLTATSATTSFNLVLSHAGVTDIVLLGVVASTVQIYAGASLVRTVAVAAPTAPSTSNTVTITGLSIAAGTNLGVTVSGTGTVSVSYLGIGSFVTVGLTQKGTQVGMDDYSTIVTDKYGVSTISRRNYSRHLQTSVSLLVSEIDTVTAIMQSVLQTICFWVADANFDAMQLLGYAKDWREITNDKTSATYSISIQGLVRDDAVVAPGAQLTPVDPWMAASNSAAAAAAAAQITATNAQTTATWSGVSGRPGQWRVVAKGASDTTAPTTPGLYNGESGTAVAGYNRSYMLVRISRATSAITFSRIYDVFGIGAVGGYTAANLAADLNSTGSDSIVVVWTFDEPQSNRLTSGLDAAMYRCGASRGIYGSPQFQFRSAYILVGIGGCGEGNGYEGYQGDTSASTNAWCDVSFLLTASGQLIISGTSATPRTLADYSYSGALDATRNNVTYSATSPSAPANGDVWVDTSAVPNTTRVRVSGVWQIGANLTTDTAQLTDGANLGKTAVWSTVSGSGRPADNATVGATWGINVTGSAAVDAAIGNAQTAANTAAINSSSALSQLTNLASDNILSPAEKPSIVQDYTVIMAEQSGIDAQAVSYGITTEKSSYDAAITALTTYLSSLAGWNTIPGSDVGIVGTIFRSKFADVYATRQALLNKISATASTYATTLISNGANLIYNSTFSNGISGWTGPGAYLIAQDAVGINLVGGLWNPIGGYALWSRQIGTINNQAGYYEFESSPIPVTALQNYIMSAYTGAHRCNVAVFLRVFNASLAVLLDGAAWQANNFEASGGQSLSGYKRSYASLVMPATAAFCKVVLRKYDSYAGSSDSYLFATQLQLEQAGANATQPGPWCDSGILDQSILRAQNPLTAANKASLGYLGDLNATYGAAFGVNITGKAQTSDIAANAATDIYRVYVVGPEYYSPAA